MVKRTVKKQRGLALIIADILKILARILLFLGFAVLAFNAFTLFVDIPSNVESRVIAGSESPEKYNEVLSIVVVVASALAVVLLMIYLFVNINKYTKKFISFCADTFGIFEIIVEIALSLFVWLLAFVLSTMSDSSSARVSAVIYIVFLLCTLFSFITAEVVFYKKRGGKYAR
jgi:hypothetical protein